VKRYSDFVIIELIELFSVWIKGTVNQEEDAVVSVLLLDGLFIVILLWKRFSIFF